MFCLDQLNDMLKTRILEKKGAVSACMRPLFRSIVGSPQEMLRPNTPHREDGGGHFFLRLETCILDMKGWPDATAYPKVAKSGPDVRV